MLPARSAIDAVIFDAGGVLLMPDAEAGRAAVATLNCDTRLEDWHRAHYVGNVVLDQMQTTDWPAHRRAIAAEVGVAADQLDAAAALIEPIFSGTAWVAADGAAEALRLLSEAGYRLAVVSNAWGMVAQWLEQHEICSVNGSGLTRVGAVIDSHVVGIEKPDPRIFGLALDALGVEPGRSLYIGDTVRFDVLGALAAGLHPVHVDPYGFCTGQHSHIAALAELTSWLTSDWAAE
jgi:putative hydrolase of the HAD superfamily